VRDLTVQSVEADIHATIKARFSLQRRKAAWSPQRTCTYRLTKALVSADHTLALILDHSSGADQGGGIDMKARGLKVAGIIALALLFLFVLLDTFLVLILGTRDSATMIVLFVNILVLIACALGIARLVSKIWAPRKDDND